MTAPVSMGFPLRRTAAALAVLGTVAASSANAAETGAVETQAVWTWFGIDAAPDAAYDAGRADDPHTVVCRVRHRRDVEAGQLVGGLCLIGGDGMARPYNGFEILQTLDTGAGAGAWADGGSPAARARALNVNAGRGPAVHVCRMVVDGISRVGMVRGETCSAAIAPDEVTSDSFDVLTAAPR